MKLKVLFHAIFFRSLLVNRGVPFEGQIEREKRRGDGRPIAEKKMRPENEMKETHERNMKIL